MQLDTPTLEIFIKCIKVFTPETAQISHKKGFFFHFLNLFILLYLFKYYQLFVYLFKSYKP